ncbi:MAG: FAD-dependent monooxygenase [Steroidobacteraceae bacterium]|nr:FAD-dependent monooxygenase [Steroidobacteraceae bacterium]
MREIRDAVVVGAGPAGSAAAILLARAGWSVALVEKETFPRRKVCGECVAASNLPLLDALGIGGAFDAVAGPALCRVALMSGERTIEADLPPPVAGTQQWGRALGRETLDVLLLERARAAGVEVLQPWSVQAIDGVPGDWHCRISAMNADESSVLRARVAIDAHGSWEALPSARRNHRRTPRGSDLLAFQANFRNVDLVDGLLPVLALDGGYGGMVVADGGLTTVACCIRRDRLEACRGAAPGLRAGEAVEAYLRTQCRGVREALQPATRIGPWLAAGPLNPGIRVDAHDGPFRIGNAAGEAHPIIGEGMSMALQSAWLLTQYLLARGEPNGAAMARQRDVARRYAAHWRRQFAPRLLFAAGFAHLAMRPRTSAPLFGLAEAWPGMLTLGARIKAPLKHAQRT